jgi:hypothetical protein
MDAAKGLSFNGFREVRPVRAERNRPTGNLAFHYHEIEVQPEFSQPRENQILRGTASEIKDTYKQRHGTFAKPAPQASTNNAQC